MQIIVAALLAVVFVISGYGVSFPNPMDQDTKVMGDDKDKEKDKDQAVKEHNEDQLSGKRKNQKHGLDRADEAAGQHGKHGRDNARKHHQ